MQHRTLCILAVGFALAGCVTVTPQDMAQKSDWDVCRFTMGGPFSQLAEYERNRRSLDCQPYYPAINARQANQNQAVDAYLRSINTPAPVLTPPVTCRTVYMGNVARTVCQ